MRERPKPASAPYLSGNGEAGSGRSDSGSRISPGRDGVAEAHEEQEADPVEEEGRDEGREEDEVVAEERRVPVRGARRRVGVVLGGDRDQSQSAGKHGRRRRQRVLVFQRFAVFSVILLLYSVFILDFRVFSSNFQQFGQEIFKNRPNHNQTGIWKVSDWFCHHEQQM